MSGIRFSTDIVIILHKSNKLKQMVMKKYFLTMATIALFAVGFAASDEEESSSNESSAIQTEQKQETEAERKAREKREKEEKIKEILKEGYEYGKEQGMQYTYYQECQKHFCDWHFTPSTDEQMEIFRQYKEQYDKGFEEGHNLKEKMRNM